MTKSPGKPRRRSILGRLARIVSGLIGLVVIAAIVVGVFAAFAPLRKLAVESLLTVALGHTIAIEGPVSVDFGQTTTISAATIRVERAGAGPSSDAQTADAPAADIDRIDSATFGFGLRAALTGRFDMRTLTLNGVRLADNSPLVGFDPDVPAASDGGRRWYGIVPGVVRLARDADIAVSDVSYRYLNRASGWVFDIAVSSISNTRSESTGDVALKVAGSINDVPLTLDGAISPVVENGAEVGDGFTLTASGPGGTLEMKSVVPTGAGASLRETSVSADVTSIGKLLDAVKVARTVEGTATLTADIDTADDVSAVKNLRSDVTFDAGPTITVEGGIADLETGTGFDLAVDSSWPRDGAGGVGEEGVMTFAVYEITAQLTGAFNALEMSDGWITTNLFADALPRFGPISAGAVRRDDRGRIAVDDIRVLAGPADDRTFDLSGQIGDLLQLSSFKLSGDISVPAAAVLGIPVPDPAGGGKAGLGRLTGSFAVSDSGGRPGIDRLSARLTDTSLAAAQVDLTSGQHGPGDTAVFGLSLAVPDYASLATALGLEPKPVETIRYKGDLSLSDGSAAINGDMTFGRTDLTGQMAVTAEGGRPLFSGKIATPALALVDARRAFEIGLGFRTLWAREKARRKTASTPARRAPVPEKAAPPPKFDIAVSAGTIEGAGDAVSGVSGRVLVDQGVVSAQSFDLTYDKGRFGFDGQVDLRTAGRPFSAKGSVSSWPLASLFEDLDVDLPITGVLESQFDVSSSGTTAKAAFDNASGNIYARVFDGEIGNRLLDLTGLVLPSWLFAPSAKSGRSRIDCFSAKFKLAPGLTTLQQGLVETDDVSVTATGLIDFRNDTIDIEAEPRALSPNLIPIVSPFAIRGSFEDPKVVVKGGVAGRAVEETLALPFNTLGTLLGVDRSGPKPRQIAASCR